MGLLRINDNRLNCGVTLISSTLGVTAAHCVVKVFTDQPLDLTSTKTRIEVSFGKQQIDRTEDTQQIRFVTKLFIHRLYDPKTLNYDVAVIQLDHHVWFNKHVKPACLSPSDWTFEAQQDETTSASPLSRAVVPWGVVSGFGGVSSSGKESLTLRKALVVIANQSACSKAMKSISVITDAMICAYGPDNGDTCKGDSGGPLVVLARDRWYLVGVTSWGDKCGTPGRYGVYARIAHPDIYKWIDDIWEDVDSAVAT